MCYTCFYNVSANHLPVQALCSLPKQDLPEISTRRKTLCTPFFELLEATRYFKVKLSKRQLRLHIRNRGAWTIMNTSTDEPVITQALFVISPRIMRISGVDQLVQRGSNMVHCHEYTYDTHRRIADRQQDGSGYRPTPCYRLLS